MYIHIQHVVVSRLVMCTKQSLKISKLARRPEWAKCKRRRRSGGRAPCSVRSSRSGPMPDSMRPVMVVAPQLPHAAAAAGHDAAPRLTPRGASTASFQHFKAISRSDRCACAGPGRFVHPKQALLDQCLNRSRAVLHNAQCNHFATGPVSKPRSKISRVVRTERPAPTHRCWGPSFEPAFCPSRRTPPLGRSFVKSCADLILAGGGVLAKVLYGGDFATSSTPEVGADAQRRAPLWCVALRRQMLHPVRRAAPSLADPGPAPPSCPSNMAKTKLQICLGASTHGSAAACSAQGALPTPMGPLSRLVLLPPALLTPFHGPICAGKWLTPRAVVLGSAPLVARLIAVGAEVRAG